MRPPSKKIFFIAIACVIVVGGLYFYFSKNNKQTYENPVALTTSQTVINQSVKNSAATDTDGDGLMDWEEILWNTDPLSADSNKDGISDAQEVSTKKAAELAAAEKAAREAQTKAQKQQGATPAKNLTLTDVLARDAFAEYVNLKQTGGTLTEENAQKIAEKILGSSNFDRNVPKFNVLNLTNTVENTDEEIYAYGNTLWDIMERNTPKNITLENEYKIFLTSIQNNDPNELKKIDPIIVGYSNTIKDMLAMRVPNTLSERHIEMLNAMNALLATIQDLRANSTDSARGLSGLVNYGQRVLGLHEKIRAITTFLREKPVNYVEGESGYILVHSI